MDLLEDTNSTAPHLVLESVGSVQVRSKCCEHFVLQNFEGDTPTQKNPLPYLGLRTDNMLREYGAKENK